MAESNTSEARAAREIAREMDKIRKANKETLDFNEDQEKSLSSMRSILIDITSQVKELSKNNAFPEIAKAGANLSTVVQNIIKDIQSGNTSVTKIAGLIQSETKELLKQKQANMSKSDSLKDQLKLLEGQKDSILESTKSLNAQFDDLEERRKAGIALTGNMSNVVKAEFADLRQKSDEYRIQSELIDKQLLSKKEEIKSTEILNSEYDKLVASAQDFLDSSEENTVAITNAAKALQSMKNTKLDDMFDDIASKLNRTPIFGKQMSGQIKKLKEEFTDSMTSAFNEAQKEGGKFMDVLKASKGMFSAAFKGLLLSAVSKLIEDLKAKFEEIEKTVTEMNKSTGLLNEQWERYRIIAANANMDLAEYGVTIEVATQAVTSLYNTFGNTDRVTKKLIETTSLMTVNLGLTADEASEYMNTMTSVGNLTNQQATNLAGATVQLAKLGKTTAKRVMQDIAKSSEYISKYMRGSVVEATKAAVQMQRMGLSLEKAGKMADTLLNWDENISAEMEASVMLGRQLNFERARALAWEGKIGEAADAAIGQIGTLSEWNEMNILQKQAIAKATGLEASEITKTLKQRELIADMDEVQKKQYEDAAAQLSNMNDMSKERLLREQSIQIETQTIAQAWDSLVSKLTPILTGIVFPVLGFIADVLGGIASALGSITEAIPGFRWLTTALLAAAMAAVLFWNGITLGISSIGIAVGAAAAIGGISGYVNQIKAEDAAGPEMAMGGVATQKMTATIGEAGAEAVVPLTEFYNKIDAIVQELIKVNTSISSISESILTAKNELISSIKENNENSNLLLLAALLPLLMPFSMFVPSLGKIFSELKNDKKTNEKLVTPKDDKKTNEISVKIDTPKDKKETEKPKIAESNINTLELMPAIIKLNDLFSSWKNEFVSKINEIIKLISNIKTPNVIIDNKEIASKMDKLISAVSSTSPNIIIDNEELASKMNEVKLAISALSLSPKIIIDNTALISKINEVVLAISALSLSPKIIINTTELAAKMDAVVSAISSLSLSPKIIIDNKELASKMDTVVAAITSSKVTIDNKELVSKMNEMILAVTASKITIDNKELISKTNEIISILSSGIIIKNDKLESELKTSMSPIITIDNKELVSKMSEMISIISSDIGTLNTDLISKICDSISSISLTPNITINNTELALLMTKLNDSISNIISNISTENSESQISSKMNESMSALSNIIISNHTELLSKINESVSAITNAASSDKKSNTPGMAAETLASSAQPAGTDNKDVVAKVDELISVMKNGFAVFMDGQKVGSAIVKGVSHPALSQTT